MRIGLTGGGSGGHFYPLIAVAEQINKTAHARNIINCELYYFGPAPYDSGLLYEVGATYVHIPAGKWRHYFSIYNFLDIFKTMWGISVACVRLFTRYPDVVFSKGGYASFPVLIACRLLFIPVVIHESDTIPGKANSWAARFASRVAVSFPEASEYFPQDKVVYTGHPLRETITTPIRDQSYEHFGFSDSSLPTLFIIGGSQGAETINTIIIDALPELVSRYNIIHQAGNRNSEIVRQSSQFILQQNENRERYKLYGFLNTMDMKRAAGIADIVISRAGSMVFEIASWGIPSIIVPITHSSNNHQKQNAFTYAEGGAASVIAENNITEHILIAEITRILNNSQLYDDMKKAALSYGKKGGAATIAHGLLDIALSHEK